MTISKERIEEIRQKTKRDPQLFHPVRVVRDLLSAIDERDALISHLLLSVVVRKARLPRAKEEGKNL